MRAIPAIKPQSDNHINHKLPEETNQKQEDCQSSSNYNRNLIEASPDPLVTIGRDGKLMDVNLATEKVTGFSRQELIKTDFADYFTDPAAARSGYRKVFDVGEVRDYPLEIRHKNGTITPVLYNATVYRDDAGNVAGVFAAARDISERRRAEQLTRDASSYNRKLLEASLDPLVTIGRDGKLSDVNKATEDITGIPRDELIGTDFSDYFTDPVAARVGYRKAFSSGEVRDYPLVVLHRNGHTTHVLYNASVFRDSAGIVIGVFAAARDVTAQRNAEDKLRLSNSYNRSLLEASLDSLVTIGRDGKLTDVNETTEAITGFSREELVGTDFSDYFTNPNAAREGYKKVFDVGEVRDYPLEIQHRDGHTTPVLYNATVYRDPEGKVAGVFAAARDITERIRAETALKKAIADLARSNQELEQFAYVASHDLQEPLRMIASYVQLIAKRYKSKLDQDGIDFINFAVDGANRMKNLINDLLSYSRVTTRGKPFELVDTRQIVNSLLKIFDLTIKDTKAQITIGELPTIFADPTQIGQLFQNLIGNAIKFRSSKPPEINITAHKELNEWVFSIADNGIGIESEFFGQLFKIFQRLHNADEYPGTGIGLAICKRIVDRHGGRIWVSSGIGKGSTFYFTIPTKQITEQKSEKRNLK